MVCRRNRMAWWAFLPADEFDALLEVAEGQRVNTIRYPNTSRVRLWTWIDAVSDASVPGAEPSIRFNRPDGPQYAGAPAEFVFSLLRQRETA